MSMGNLELMEFEELKLRVSRLERNTTYKPNVSEYTYTHNSGNAEIVIRATGLADANTILEKIVQVGDYWQYQLKY